MGLGTIALILGATLSAVLFAMWLYRAREVPVDGSAVLVAARAAAIALVLLLLLNPRIPGGAVADGGSSWVLVDRSASMGADLVDGGSSWTAASDEAGSGQVVLFGDTPQRTIVSEGTPTDPNSRLLSGLRLAIEAGARDVRVVSDFRLTDLDAAVALLEQSGVGADFEPVGGPVRNVGISEFAIGTSGSGTVAEVELFGEAAGTDSVEVEVFAEDRSVATATLAVPADNATERAEISIPSPPADGRTVRYSVRATLAGDGYADDDARSTYVQSGTSDGGVVLISTAPDWEPRFLLPTLRDVTGFEGEGYLAVADGRFLRAFSEDGSVAGVDSATVRSRALRAELVVVHASEAIGPWIRSWLPRVSRLILIAPDAEALTAMGLSVAPPRSGEWYVADNAPVSPMSGGLAGVSFDGLPPLGPAVSVESAPGWSSALAVNYQRQGSAVPALMLSNRGNRRVAVAPAQGWWRWAFREGPARDAYRRVWSSVAGWMMGSDVLAASDEIAPVRDVIDRGAVVDWVAPGLAGDTVAVQIGPVGAFVVDTLIAVDSTETFRTPKLPAGTYAYRAAARTDSTNGRFDVSAYTAELRTPVADVESRVDRSAPSSSLRVSGGRRLRTAGLPYLLLIAVLSAEWLLRRRKGLR